MAEAVQKESSWWDGTSDFLGELWDGGKAYLDSEQAKHNADKAASENATLAEQARIEALRQQQAQAQQDSQTTKLMIGGGVALVILVVLVLIFK